MLRKCISFCGCKMSLTAKYLAPAAKKWALFRHDFLHFCIYKDDS